ncbi:MAG: OB-fold domain-containing protein [Thermoplasmata archaeon]|uniref:OB-fold domain-containing protein n=1 Tax=Candidatus Sysuiplasma superficiale TaxID=2823368 RepID=A0A8J8CFI4_9ARCH|nr:OB-fold domain-containing protein [Candidatus Sysuiplasma superficiale]MBX8643451.1 OB-fold domain-containing protein [Candidatus Sysuiplasma superficiale]
MHSIADFFESAERGELKGYRCMDCGHRGTTFALACPRCGSARLEDSQCSHTGSVRSFTILNVPSEMFADSAPYAYVVVDLDDGCTASGWMKGISTPAEISTGMRVRFAGLKGKGIAFEKL